MKGLSVLDNILNTIIPILRYALPIFALAVTLTCIASLFRNRPRVHKMAQLIDKNNNSIIEIEHWETSIGKSKANDIVLPFPSVSRFHAVIAKKKKDWVVTDTFSKNGIFVNGNKVEGNAVIEDGDVIEIGGVPLQFQCAEALSRKLRRISASRLSLKTARLLPMPCLLTLKAISRFILSARMCLSAEETIAIFKS